MEDAFLSFSRSLPAATLLMLLVLLASRSRASAVRRHQWLGWGLALAALLPFMEPQLPQWRILPRIGGMPWAGAADAVVPWMFLFGAVWLVGVAGMLARTILGLLLLRWHERATIPVDDDGMLAVVDCCREQAGLPRSPTISLQPEYSMPLTWGWKRPRIWLPLAAEDWSKEELECVLLHEMAHIERRDFLAEILSRICLAIYWFHPLAWLLSRRIELAREMACDDQVLLAGKPAVKYAESLAHIGAGLPVQPPATAAGFLGRKPLITRLIGIADPWRTRTRLTNEDIWATAAPLTMASVFVCSLGIKAAAEIHDSRAAVRPPARTAVVSVWDDLVMPTVKGLRSDTETPTAVSRWPRQSAGSFVRAQPEQALSPRDSDAIREPVRLARLPAPKNNRTVLSRLDSPRGPQRAPQMTLIGRFPRSTAAVEDNSSASQAPASESPDKPSKTKSADATATKTKSSEPDPENTPGPRRELSATIISENGHRELNVDCLVAKGTGTKLLRAEMTTDFKHWTDLPTSISRLSVDAETDRLSLRVVANSGNGFIRIREVAPTTPGPDKKFSANAKSASEPSKPRRGRSHWRKAPNLNLPAPSPSSRPPKLRRASGSR